MSGPKKTLTIGMPVYNGERYISRAIDCLMNQDFTEWVLYISDNASSDKTEQIAKEYASRDGRILYSRQEKNIGAIGNFLSLVEDVETPYFMWAASDDEWSKNYLSSCISVMQNDAQVGFSGGKICNIDDVGNIIRKYNSFEMFQSISTADRMKKFIAALEIDGKANMIYSIFRTDIIQSVCRIPNILQGWGADMAFVAAALSRTRYEQATNALLYKRVISKNDVDTAILLEKNNYYLVEYGGNFPPRYFLSYTMSLLRGINSLALKAAILVSMAVRLVRLCKFVGRR